MIGKPNENISKLNYTINFLRPGIFCNIVFKDDENNKIIADENTTFL